MPSVAPWRGPEWSPMPTAPLGSETAQGARAVGTCLWPLMAAGICCFPGHLHLLTCSQTCAGSGVGGQHRATGELVRSRDPFWVFRAGKRLPAGWNSSVSCPGPPRDKPALAVRRGGLSKQAPSGASPFKDPFAYLGVGLSLHALEAFGVSPKKKPPVTAGSPGSASAPHRRGSSLPTQASGSATG